MNHLIFADLSRKWIKRASIRLSCYFIFFFTFVSLPLQAQVMAELIHAPRGVVLQVSVYYGNGFGPTLIMAPNDSCQNDSHLNRIFAELGQIKSYTVIQYNRTSCLQSFIRKSHTNQLTKSLDEEIEDFQTVLHYIQKNRLITGNGLILAGQGVGGEVIYREYKSIALAKSLILVSPNCSEVRNGKTISTIDDNYPSLNQKKQPIMIILGEKSSTCSSQILRDYIDTAHSNFEVVVGMGDHNFRVNFPTGTLDEKATIMNIFNVVRRALDWGLGRYH